jgi:hypothetical protein
MASTTVAPSVKSGATRAAVSTATRTARVKRSRPTVPTGSDDALDVAPTAVKRSHGKRLSLCAGHESV